jgi:hypothetical protein
MTTCDVRGFFIIFDFRESWELRNQTVRENSRYHFIINHDWWYDRDCSDDLNHAVLVTRYGSENGSDYRIVKNSWGSSWDENGYIRMAKNKDNRCGIASDATYPTGVGSIQRERLKARSPSVALVH